jgi:hypothetical protein
VRPIAVAALLRRLARVPGLRVDSGDDPVLGDLASDPPAPIGAIGAFGRLHVLPSDQRQQPQRLPGPLLQRSVGEHRDQPIGVVHQGRHQRVPGLRVVPIDPGLAHSRIVVAAALLGDHRRRARHLPAHPADRRDQLRDRVLGRDRVLQDRGVHRPPPASGQDPGLGDHPPDRLVDPLRPGRAGQPPPPVDQRGRVEPACVQRHPGGDLPAQVTAGRLSGLGIRQVMQRLQAQDRRGHRRRQRRPPSACGEQVGEVRIGKQLPPVLGQEREHALCRHQVPDQRRRVQQPSVCSLSPLHARILSTDTQQPRHHRVVQWPPSVLRL